MAILMVSIFFGIAIFYHVLVAETILLYVLLLLFVLLLLVLGRFMQCLLDHNLNLSTTMTYSHL